MHWLLEERFGNDEKYFKLTENLSRLNIAHSFCKVVPFSDNDLTSDIDLDTIQSPIYASGSITLARILKRRGYKPGGFISENISFDSLLKNYGNELLNSDMIIGKLCEIETDMKEFFCRPMEDTKSFTSQVITKVDFEEYKKQIVEVSRGGYSTVTPDTMVIISSPKKIQQECRFFIIDKKISTYSQYKLGESANYCPVVDSYIIDYVKEIISREFQPDECYCLDIAVSEGMPKILEVNSINSSGLYAIDTQKYIMDIEAITEKYKLP